MFKIRPAIAMIELIFSIVIMGIVMMSAPMLISTSTQSTYVSLQQEGINEAASRIHVIMGYDWDENNVFDNYPPTILNTTSATADLQKVGTTERRIGIPMSSQRSYIDMNNTDYNASTVLGSEGGDSDDMDDYIDNNSTVDSIEAATIDYIEQQGEISINTAITYGADDSDAGGYNYNIITFTPFGASPTATSNIKNITVTLTSTSGVSDLAKNIQLSAFSCNIGGYTFEEKEF